MLPRNHDPVSHVICPGSSCDPVSDNATFYMHQAATSPKNPSPLLGRTHLVTRAIWPSSRGGGGTLQVWASVTLLRFILEGQRIWMSLGESFVVAYKVTSSAFLLIFDPEQVASLPVLMTRTQQVYCPARLRVKAAQTIWSCLCTAVRTERSHQQVNLVY